jgi:hypothetical protein
MKPINVDIAQVHKYLEEVLKESITDLQARVFGVDDGSVKGYGYGRPLLLEFTQQGKTRKLVLETMPAGAFGHEHFSDRAQIMLWKHATSAKLPGHAATLDAGAFLDRGRLASLGSADEFFVLTEFIQGEGYYKDLERLMGASEPEALDKERTKALASYLAHIHTLKHDEPELYVRRIRDLVGHGECLMGLTDSYPADFVVPGSLSLEEIEKRAVSWRWRIKGRTGRLCQVHGDFHPWNILFDQGAEFMVIDRSRGEWGEPADDVAALSINYMFFAVQQHGRLTGACETLFRLFWDTYLEHTSDLEIKQVIQPFYAWRGLVVASPVWYPRLAPEVRAKLFRFIDNVLEINCFEPAQVNAYLGE